MVFLTPGIRGARTKSLLTTSASKNIASNQSAFDESADDFGPFSTTKGGEPGSSSKKPRSMTRGHSILQYYGFFAPMLFHNCADCGSFYISVSRCTFYYPAGFAGD